MADQTRDMLSTGIAGPEDAPGNAIYLSGEDNLRIRSFGSLASTVLALEGRLLDLDGNVIPIVETHTPSTDRTMVTTLHTLAAGFLLNLQLRASSAAPRRGQVFAIVEIVRGRLGAVQPLGVIIQGYVQDTTALAWPGALIESSVEGCGVIRSITGTDPAAGAEISETVPTNARWRLIHARALLVTSAVVANRTASWLIDDATNVVIQQYGNFNQAASLTVTYSAGAFGTFGATAGAFIDVALPPDLILPGGFRIRTATLSMDVGDNWGAPQLLVEEWIED